MKVRIIYRKLTKQRAWGLAHIGENRIEIDYRAKGRKLIELICHEYLHLKFPEASEEDVTEAGADLARLLWKEGYRRVENHDQQPLQDE